MGNERGAIRGLLLLLALAAGAWFIVVRWWPAHNYRRFSAQIELAVNRELYAAGVYDHQILSQVNRERSRWGLVWIESNRRIIMERAGQASDLAQRFRRIARRYGAQMDQRTLPNGVSLEIHQWFVTFQRIELLNLPAARQLPVAETPKAPEGPKVAIVVDDVAYDLNPMDRFASLGVPLTFAVLPRDRHTRALAEKATRLHFPVILHLPMEPIDLAHNNPGGAGLYLQMSPEKLHEQFEKDVESVPYIVGINNHMGSAFTENAGKMALVMRWIKERGLFFLDSRTSLHSVAPQAAKAAGVPCRVNEAFLDNSDTVEGIEAQLDEVMRLALKRKQAIAIGHYRRKHLVEALAHKIPEFEAHGISFVTLPSLYRTR